VRSGRGAYSWNMFVYASWECGASVACFQELEGVRTLRSSGRRMFSTEKTFEQEWSARKSSLVYAMCSLTETACIIKYVMLYQNDIYRVSGSPPGLQGAYESEDQKFWEERESANLWKWMMICSSDTPSSTTDKRMNGRKTSTLFEDW